MSKPVSSMAIGGFMLAAFGLLVLALLVFGGGEFFRPKVHAVVFFDSSLNGLNRGAPVKVQGVQVGTVRDIVLVMDQLNHRTLRPVVLEIDPSAIVTTDGRRLGGALTDSERKKRMQELVDAGLRARLETQSILTGLLYVDLSFQPGTRPQLVGMNFRDLPEVPSVPTTVEEVKAALENLVRRIQDMPLETMVNNISATLVDIRTIVGSDETRKSREALAQALGEARQLLAQLNRDLPAVVKGLDGTLRNADQTFRTANQAFSSADRTFVQAGKTAEEATLTAREAAGAIRDIRSETRPVLAAAEQALLKASKVLEEARGAVGNIASRTDADSTLEDTLAEVQDASRSLRILADSLERNPSSLFFGRSR